MTVERIEGGQELSSELLVAAPVPTSMLQQFAVDARAAYTVAQSVAKTTFVPTSYKRRGSKRDGFRYLEPDEVAQNVCAAFLAGAEIGLKPMQSLQAINIIEGQPALSALAMRALVQGAGHDIWIHEQSVERSTMLVTMRGRRAGSEHVTEVTWTLGRARQAGLLEKDNWQKDPFAMLVARASAALCRIIASDVLMGLAYSAEELGDEELGEDGSAADLPGVAQAPSEAPALQRRQGPVQEPPTQAPELEAAEVQEPVEVEVADLGTCEQLHEDGRRCQRQPGHEGKHYFGRVRGAESEAGPVAPAGPAAATSGDVAPSVGAFEPSEEELAGQEEGPGEEGEPPLFPEPSDADLEAALEADRAAAAEAAEAAVEEPVEGEVVEEPAAAGDDDDDDPWKDFQ